ncbi:MAG: molybdopterin dinucleotide binding domain-containing protein [Chloroflexota bacterium]|nr:molybdopterin dinucleotide binding domain-containing protein [Chloroflexota bacterium]
MSEFILITGRTAKQGTALHKGKDSEEYHQATGFVEMSRADMDNLGGEEGRRVRVRTEFGETELELRAGELPAGMLFVPMGPAVNVLIGAETRGTGMPDSKGLKAEVELFETSPPTFEGIEGGFV